MKPEKSEHFYHQHLSYISLETDFKQIGPMLVKEQFLVLKLDSGYTTKLHVEVSANLFYSDNRKAKRGVEEVYGGLLGALQDHKMSQLRSSVEAGQLGN